jgi:hypothetical protein
VFVYIYKQNFSVLFGSLFCDAFSVTRLYSVHDRMISEWWCWVDEDNNPCLNRDSNPQSQRPSNQGLRLRPSGHWNGLKPSVLNYLTGLSSSYPLTLTKDHKEVTGLYWSPYDKPEEYHEALQSGFSSSTILSLYLNYMWLLNQMQIRVR